MDAKSILAKLALQPAANIVKISKWMLGLAEKHWAAECEKHQGTNAEAYNRAFDNWHTIRQIRQRISQPVRRLGGRKAAA
jgi:hypothetical protein